MSDTEHSLFSASGSSGWMVCHGKIAMEQGRRTSSVFADEGTAAHTLATWVMQARIDGAKTGKRVVASNYLGQTIKVGEREFEVTDEMAEAVDAYVDAFMIWSNHPGAVRMVEQKVSYHSYLQVDEGLAFGTSDGVALVYGAPELEWMGTVYPTGDELQIHDFKYGRGVRVAAEENSQMRLYALGCLQEYGFLGDFKRVRMVIHQPRIDHLDEEVLTVAELEAWAKQLPAIAQKVQAATADFKVNAGFANGGDSAATWLHPSEKACRFCDAKAICPALLAEVGEIVGDRRPASPEEFDDLTIDGKEAIADYGSNFLAVAFSKSDLVEAWLHAVRSEVDRRVLRGEQIPDPDGGFLKVVEGRKGNRSWTDKAAVEKLAGKKVQKLALMSPTEAEKALAKSDPETWVKLQPLIERKPGPPSVARASDKRAPITVQATADDFDDLTAEGGDQHPFRN